MGLVLIGIITGLSVLDTDVTAAGLTAQQQEFLRQWKTRNQDASQLRVVWEPADALDNQARTQLTRHTPRTQRRPRTSRSNAVLKAGYPSQQPMAAPAPPPAPPPRVYVISAPAPPMPQPAKPAAQSMPSYNPAPAPQPIMKYPPQSSQSMMSYPMPAAVPKPQPAHQPMPAPMSSYDPAPAPQPIMKYPPPQSSQHSSSSSQSMMSYSMPAAASKPHASPMPAAMPMPKPATAVQSSYSVSQAQPGMSYRVIYIQPPEQSADTDKASSPPSYPSHQPAPAPKPPMMSYPPHAAQPSSSQPTMSYSMPAAPAKPQPAAAVEPQPGMSYRVIYIQPPAAEAKSPSPPAMPHAPSPPSQSYPPAAPAPPAKTDPPADEPQTLLIVVSSPSSSAMNGKKSAEPSLPACSPAPGKQSTSQHHRIAKTLRLELKLNPLKGRAVNWLHLAIQV